ASVHLLQRVHQPAGGAAAVLGRGAADGDLRRQRDAARADRRRRNRGHHEERGERLRGALEHGARHHLRADHHLHARRAGARLGAAVEARLGVMAQASARRGAGRGGARVMMAPATASVPAAGTAAPVALGVRGLTKSFGGLKVTQNVNLMVAPGERRLIIGPNGAGKTTLFNLITGEITPDSGSVILNGQDITRLPSRHRPHLGLARTYQIITLFARDTILRNVTLALLGLSHLRWNPFIDVDRQHHLVDAARAALARVGLEHLSSRPLAQTSYGERRRVEIAM